MKDSLDHTTSGTHLSSKDGNNANELLGACDARTSFKMHIPSNYVSNTSPAGEIGKHLHVDTLSFVAEDEKSDFIMLVPLKHESTGHVNQPLVEAICIANFFGHKVTDITSDSGANLIATAVDLGLLGIKMHYTVPVPKFE